MAELPEREQACSTFDTLYTLAKKLETGQLACTHRYAPSSDAYGEKPRHYPVPVGRVAALEEEGVVLTDPTSGEDSKSEEEHVLSSGDEPLSEGRAKMLCVWVTWRFC